MNVKKPLTSYRDEMFNKIKNHEFGLKHTVICRVKKQEKYKGHSQIIIKAYVCKDCCKNFGFLLN